MIKSAKVGGMKAWWMLALAALLFAAGCGTQMEEGRIGASTEESTEGAGSGDAPAAGDVDMAGFPMNAMTSDKENWKNFKMETSGLEGNKRWVLNYDTTNDDAGAIEKFYADQMVEPEWLDGGGFVMQVNGKTKDGHTAMLQIEAPDKQTDPEDMTHVTITVEQTPQ